MKVKIEERDGQKVIVVEAVLGKELSGSGKSFLLATTRGIAKTGVQYEGQELEMGLNVFIRNPDYKKPEKAKKGKVAA